MDNVLGDRLRKIRERKNLTQKRAASIFGLTNFQLSRYERGEANPDPDLIAKFADYYEVTGDYLLGRTDNPHESTRDEIKRKALFFNEDEIDEEDWEFVEQAYEMVKKKRQKQKEKKKDNK